MRIKTEMDASSTETKTLKRSLEMNTAFKEP